MAHRRHLLPRARRDSSKAWIAAWSLVATGAGVTAWAVWPSSTLSRATDRAEQGKSETERKKEKMSPRPFGDDSREVQRHAVGARRDEIYGPREVDILSNRADPDDDPPGVNSRAVVEPGPEDFEEDERWLESLNENGLSAVDQDWVNAERAEAAREAAENER
jgi:hypothetical protein